MAKGTSHIMRLLVFSLVWLAASSLPITTVVAAAIEPNSLLENVSTAEHRFDVHDDKGVGMDTAKIIQSSPGNYLAVYHHLISNAFEVRVATSNNLFDWTYLATLETTASQPTIASLTDGSFVVGYEKGSGSICGSGHCLVFRHYKDTTSFQTGPYDEVVLNRTLSACHEGTPNIYAATLNPDIQHSIINVGFHYFSGCNVDREAFGTLTNFTTWKAQSDSNINRLFTNLGTINGNVGDRDAFFYNGKPYSITEAQYTKNDYSAWRPYLFDRTANSLTRLNLQTRATGGGSISFGNPTYTELTLPAAGPTSGKVGFVSTEFIFSEGSAPSEAGVLIYYAAYPTQPVPDTMRPVVSVTTPPDGSTVRSGTTVSIKANASDNVGVAKVAFYVNGALVCVSPFAPYSCNWTVPQGPGIAYSIKAQSFDNSSNTAQSSVKVTSR